MTDFKGLLGALHGCGAKVILVGGVAATVHGSSRMTVDVDVAYERSPENFEKLVRGLAPLKPYLRGAPPGLPFRWDAEILRKGLNFTLTTTLGALDLLGEITGGGGYDDLLPHTVEVEVHGHKIPCLDLPTLIRVKRAAGRPRDLETVAELESLLEDRRSGEEE